MLKLVTNFVNGKKLGVKAQGFTEGSREKLAGAPATFISVDNTRALDTLGELGQFKVVRKVVLPKTQQGVRRWVCSRRRRGPGDPDSSP